MDEKHQQPLLDGDSRAPRPQDPEMAPFRNGRSWLSCFNGAALIILLGLFLLARTFQCSDPNHLDHHGQSPAVYEQSVLESKKVSLEAHIMSKCPDATDCFQKLIIPTMANISSKVDFTLSFIGKVSDSDDLICPHGESECLGDMLELCAASLYPDPKIYLGFTYCLLNHYKDIPQEAMMTDCALAHGIDFSKLNDCVSQDDGAHGMDMLRKSVDRSRDANVTKSCTVRLDEKIWCIRDGREWKDCPDGSSPDDLMKAINDLYEE